MIKSWVILISFSAFLLTDCGGDKGNQSKQTSIESFFDMRVSAYKELEVIPE